MPSPLGSIRRLAHTLPSHDDRPTIIAPPTPSEKNLSETAFFVKQENDYELR